MSLHPHVPHELKDFSKHLFATFLGLLMALGLESWHQEHTRTKAAAESYRSLLEEIQANQKEADLLTKEYDKAIASNQATLSWLAQVVRARRHNPNAPLPPDMKMGIWKPDAAYRTSAWSVAVAAQHVGRFPQGKMRPLTEYYEAIRTLQTFQDQTDFLPGLAQLFTVETTADQEALMKDMTLPELEQALASMRVLHMRVVMLKRLTGFLQKHGVDVLKTSQGH